MANDIEINERLERVDEIIDELDADEYDCDEGEVLYEEGHRLLVEVRDLLNEGSGDVVELD